MKKMIIGKIVNTFGIRGELKVVPDTDFVEERFAPGQTLTICSLRGDQIVTIASVETQGTAAGAAGRRDQYQSSGMLQRL
ncbi:MAG: hypothetical protein ACLSA6_08030 [Holdemania massiliensis]